MTLYFMRRCSQAELFGPKVILMSKIPNQNLIVYNYSGYYTLFRHFSSSMAVNPTLLLPGYQSYLAGDNYACKNTPSFSPICGGFCKNTALLIAIRKQRGIFAWNSCDNDALHFAEFKEIPDGNPLMETKHEGIHWTKNRMINWMKNWTGN